MVLIAVLAALLLVAEIIPYVFLLPDPTQKPCKSSSLSRFTGNPTRGDASVPAHHPRHSRPYAHHATNRAAFPPSPKHLFPGSYQYAWRFRQSWDHSSARLAPCWIAEFLPGNHHAYPTSRRRNDANTGGTTPDYKQRMLAALATSQHCTEHTRSARFVMLLEPGCPIIPTLLPLLCIE